MLTAIIDIQSGNLHSAEKAFQRMAREVNGGNIVVTANPKIILGADRIVLPGDGAFPNCALTLEQNAELSQAIKYSVEKRTCPFLGICVGMQLMAKIGYEFSETQGLGWIDGEVVKISPSNCTSRKVPHMGWNDLIIDHKHPVLTGIGTGNHAYFVHSYHMVTNVPIQRLAHVNYGGEITAIVARDNIIGTQFHPEKSQITGLKLIANFLKWTP
ncbi:MAG: imidazole glycerol phosphate synthase subunit HisH [Aestuariivita sp.]|nr:imidazole glycerol phosphate synthase subunit HisH [Aestuariivita sp.]